MPTNMAKKVTYHEDIIGSLTFSPFLVDIADVFFLLFALFSKKLCFFCKRVKNISLAKNFSKLEKYFKIYLYIRSNYVKILYALVDI